MQGSHKYFKAHGSIDWVYAFNGTFKESLEGRQMSDVLYENGLINLLKGGGNSVQLRKLSSDLDAMHCPAISIPVPQDKDFIVPEYKHLLSIEIKSAKKVLIIGWSANDEYFLDLLKENLVDQSAELFLVGTRNVSAVREKMNFKEWVGVKSTEGGFSGLFKDYSTIESFLTS